MNSDGQIASNHCIFKTKSKIIAIKLMGSVVDGFSIDQTFDENYEVQVTYDIANTYIKMRFYQLQKNLSHFYCFEFTSERTQQFVMILKEMSAKKTFS